MDTYRTEGMEDGLMNNTYSFYFDESFHGRRIRITEEGVFNIWKEDRNHDKYVGCFCWMAKP